MSYFTNMMRLRLDGLSERKFAGLAAAFRRGQVYRAIEAGLAEHGIEASPLEVVEVYGILKQRRKDGE